MVYGIQATKQPAGRGGNDVDNSAGPATAIVWRPHDESCAVAIFLELQDATRHRCSATAAAACINISKAR